MPSDHVESGALASSLFAVLRSSHLYFWMIMKNVQ